MDRLHPLTPSSTGRVGLLLLTFSLAGCDQDAAEQTDSAPPSRYAAVTQKQSVSASDLEGFCDAQPQSAFASPELMSPAPASTGPFWLNVWATWCKSCVDEIPMIEEWKTQDKLSVLYVSADEDIGSLDSFKEKHPSYPSTLRLQSPEGLEEWASKVGLDAGAGLPIHVFVDGANKVRCVRAGAIQLHHRSVVKHLLKR